MRLERAVDVNRVPLLGVADVVDRDVVVLTPEERDGIEALAIPQHVAGGDLALALRDDPVLDADALAGTRIGPARHVPCGEDPGRARFEVLVHGDATVQRQACLLGESGRRPDADTHHDEVGIESRASAERHGSAVDARHRLPKMEDDALRFVQRLNEAANFRAHDALERHAFRRDHVDVDPPASQRRRDLEADEARADHHHMFGRARLVDEGATVREGTQIVHLRAVGARDRQTHRIGAGRNQQRAERAPRAAFEHNLSRADVDRRHARAEQQLDAPFREVLRRPQRNPVVLRMTGEIVFRQVRPIARRCIIRADHRDRAVISFPSEHVGRRQPGAAAADDDDGRWRERRLP